MHRRVYQYAMAGQGFVEYALVLMFVALVIIGALAVMGGTLREAYQSIWDQLPFH